MRKITLVLILLSFLMGSTNCSDNDDNGNNSQLQQKVDKQIEAVVNSLSTNESVSKFRTSLSKFNTSAYSYENENLTLFVFTDEALSNSLKSNANISFEQKYLAHHIASGLFDLEGLKKATQIKMLDGTITDIVTDNGVVYINGVEVGTPTQVSNSVVYIINKLIPEKGTNEKTITLKVLAVNKNWSESSPEEGFPATNAYVSIYHKEDTSKIYKVTGTDKNGIATFTIDPAKDYYYKVEQDDLMDLYDNLIITGIFRTQEEINNSPDYGEKKKELGALKFYDVNGDGKIDREDWVEKRTLNKDLSTVQTVFIAKKINDIILPPDYEISDNDMVEFKKLYDKSKAQYLSIDSKYSSLESRQPITATDHTLSTFWQDSYTTIRVTNSLLERPADTPDQTDKKNIIKKYRADLHYYLAIVFGNIAIADKKLEYGDPLFKQVSFEEALDFIEKELSEVYNKLSDEDQIESLQLSALIGMYKKTYIAYKIARQNIERAISLSENEDLVKYIISAECTLEMGNIPSALYDVNTILLEHKKPELPSSVTAEELRRVIHELYDLYADTGLKYPNIIRWGENATWGKYSLMPINPNEINISGGSLKQNPGW